MRRKRRVHTQPMLLWTFAISEHYPQHHYGCPAIVLDGASDLVLAKFDQSTRCSHHPLRPENLRVLRVNCTAGCLRIQHWQRGPDLGTSGTLDDEHVRNFARCDTHSTFAELIFQQCRGSSFGVPRDSTPNQQFHRRLLYRSDRSSSRRSRYRAHGEFEKRQLQRSLGHFQECAVQGFTEQEFTDQELADPQLPTWRVERQEQSCETS